MKVTRLDLQNNPRIMVVAKIPADAEVARSARVRYPEYTPEYADADPDRDAWSEGLRQSLDLQYVCNVLHAINHLLPVECLGTEECVRGRCPRCELERIVQEWRE